MSLQPAPAPAHLVRQGQRRAQHLGVFGKPSAQQRAAVLQLLAALSNMEHTWHLVEASPTFEEACRTMGFAHWLDKRYLKNSTES